MVDQRLDEPPVVAVAAAQLERLAEVLLGLLQPAVDHVVPALLGQRRGGAVGIARRAVEAQRLAGEGVGALPAAARSHAPASVSSASAHAIGSPTSRRGGHGGVAQRGCVRGGDEHRAPSQCGQRGGLDGRLAGFARRRQCRLAVASRHRRRRPCESASTPSQ